MKFSQASSWKAHGIPFGATVQNLEHRLMLISMIWRFQECHWDRWNRSGTLESIVGDGCSISNSDNEEMASNNNPNDEEIYDGTLKNIYILKQKIHDYF